MTPEAFPAYRCIGIASGTLALIVSAASRMSAHDFGCQSSGRPAAAKTSRLYQMPMSLADIGIPYVWPSADAAPARHGLGELGLPIGPRGQTLVERGEVPGGGVGVEPVRRVVHHVGDVAAGLQA